MGRFFDCQLAVVPWGYRARFRRARVGLLKKGSSDSTSTSTVVYLTLFFHSNETQKFPIDQNTEILPAAIRFKDSEKDVFIKEVDDKQRFETMMREIKIIKKKEKLTQTPGKADVFEKYISSIPNLSSINPRELVPSRHQSIHEITLTDCQLKTVPKQLESFSATLNFLDLSNNNINNLPRTFCCKMKNLNALNLSNNSIETLPIEIKFFRRLVDFDISNNHLRMLPSTFSDLKSLRNLNVANNNLSQLPAFRKEQIRLKRLDVSHNPLDGALNEFSTFEVYPSFDGQLGYNENLICNHPLSSPAHNAQNNQTKPIPSLFEMTMLRIVRCDRLLRIASEESLPQTIVSTMQRDIFKCYRCSLMNILPAYNSTDILDYVDQVEILTTTGNYRHGMTFMKLICRTCFDTMSS